MLYQEYFENKKLIPSFISIYNFLFIIRRSNDVSENHLNIFLVYYLMHILIKWHNIPHCRNNYKNTI